MDNLTVTGISHCATPLALREKLSFKPGDIPCASRQLLEQAPLREAVILSTCNRIEIYGLSANDTGIGPEPVVEFLHKYHQVPREDFIDGVYHYQSQAAVEHLFKVAAGLDAMVLGETQILGQVKSAFNLALENAVTGKITNDLFQKAFSTAKQVHTETRISETRVSVSSVAVDFASGLFSSFSDKALLQLGAGETGILALKHFIGLGLESIKVTNRTYEKAKEVAGEFGALAFPLENLEEYLPRVDIILAAADTERFLISPEMMKSAMLERKNRPTFIIDLSVPRSVNPDISKIANVFLYNLDDLETVVNSNIEKRQRELAKCLQIIETEKVKFISNNAKWETDPLLAELNRHVHDIREEEWRRLESKLAGLDPKLKEEIEYTTKRIASKILHNPLANIRQEAKNGSGYQIVDFVRRIFFRKQNK
ncbi:glutamyl-tRNA reductase [Planctomycetota bacterium]